MSSKETILVVEDDRALRHGLAMNLELQGYHVITASDGETGMQQAFDARPQLIVLDIMLPGWSGLEILKELRKRDENVPVLNTAVNDARSVSQSLTAMGYSVVAAENIGRRAMSRALVEDVVQGQAFSLQEVDFETINTPGKMIRTFIGFEDDTIAFYEILKTLIDDPVIAGQMEQIIDEEKKHMTRFRELLSES